MSGGSWQPGTALMAWRNAAACGKAAVGGTGGPGSQGHGRHPHEEMPCVVPVLPERGRQQGLSMSVAVTLILVT